MKYISSCKEETHKLASKLASISKPGFVITLKGNLGTGKTTFTQGFAKSMGIQDNVGSPTFKLISEYKGPQNWLYHIDAYRLKNAQEFLNIGGEDYLNPKEGITIIEWPENIWSLLPSNKIQLQFTRSLASTSVREIYLLGVPDGF